MWVPVLRSNATRCIAPGIQTANTQPESSDPPEPRFALMSLRRFLPSSRRCFEPSVGLVGRRGVGRVTASRSNTTRRSIASVRLRSWVRNRCAWITITPSLVMRWPARRSSRACASAGSATRRVSKRNCAAVASLLTFCPPGPEARTKEISMSLSSIERSREIRSMASPNGLIFPDGIRRDRIPGLSTICLAARLSIRRRGRGLHRGLRGATDDYGEEALAPQPLRGRLRIIQRHGLDEGVALLDIVDRELVELILQQRPGEFRRRIERQHLRALEIGFGLIQFLLGRAVHGDAADFLVDGIDGLAGAVGTGSGIADEHRGVIHP